MSWPEVALGEVATIKANLEIPDPAKDPLIPCLGPDALETRTGVIQRRTTVGEVNPRSAKYRFKKGNVLYSKIRPNLAKAALAIEEGFISADMYPLSCGPELLPDYLLHVLLTPKFTAYATRASTRAQIPELNREALFSFRFPLPPLDEQRRIVDILNRANGIRRLRREALDKTRQLIPALFDDMFGDPAANPSGWPIRPFGELVAETQLGLVRSAKETGEHHPMPYLRMDAIVGDGSLKLAGMRRVRASEAEIRRYSLRAGDFLFNTRNSRELVGKVGLVTTDHLMIFNNNIMRVRFCASVLPEYMTFLFCTTHVQTELEKRKSGTTAVFAIYYKNLKTMPVVIPPLSLQQEFASQVTDIQATIAQQERMVEASEQLVAALMARLFGAASKPALAAAPA